jgi:peptidoglycan/LPS O-acetylase OafA/YrhL
LPRLSPTYETFRSTRYFAALDGLRCLSILGVIFHHTVAMNFPSLMDRGFGAFGVDLFFVISGFLITTLLLREREQNGTINLRNFYIRRTLRIFPLYYTILFVYVVVVFLTARTSDVGQQFFRNVPAFATYTSNWFVEQNRERIIFVFAWSLATEEQFYLVWPWIQKYLRGAWASLAITGLLCVSLLARFGIFGSGADVPLWVQILASIAPPICLGVLLAHMLHSRKGFEIAARIWTPFNGVIFLAVTALSLASNLALRSYIVDLALLGLVASCVTAEDHALRPALSINLLRKIGIVSYGMYLMHMLSFNAVKSILGRLHLDQPLLAFLATVAVAFGAASLSFKYYESIFLRFKEKFASKPAASTLTGLDTPASREARANETSRVSS